MRKAILFVLLVALLFLIFYPKNCDTTHHVLPAELAEEKGLVDSTCLCVGFKFKTSPLPLPGGPTEARCFGIPVKYCQGYIDGEYKVVRCK